MSLFLRLLDILENHRAICAVESLSTSTLIIAVVQIHEIFPHEVDEIFISSAHRLKCAYHRSYHKNHISIGGYAEPEFDSIQNRAFSQN